MSVNRGDKAYDHSPQRTKLSIIWACTPPAPSPTAHHNHNRTIAPRSLELLTIGFKWRERAARWRSRRSLSAMQRQLRSESRRPNAPTQYFGPIHHWMLLDTQTISGYSAGVLETSRWQYKRIPVGSALMQVKRTN